MQTTELIKIDNSIEKPKAMQIQEAYRPAIERYPEQEEKMLEVIKEASVEITESVCKKAKRIRLDIAKIRTDADKIRKSEKESYLRVGQAIDGVYKYMKLKLSESEEKLFLIENHFEIMEKERKEKIAYERLALLEEYDVSAGSRDLANMDTDTFDALLAMKKKQHEEKLEAERIAEEKRQEEERLDKLENERRLKCLPYVEFWGAEPTFRTMSPQEFIDFLDSIVEKKETHDKEQAKIKAENEKLRKEAEEKERQRKIEENERIKKERETEQKRKAEEHRKALEKERKAKEEIERKIREQKEKEEREKAAEEARKAEIMKAGDKTKMVELLKELCPIIRNYEFSSDAYKGLKQDLVDTISSINAFMSAN